MRWKDEGTNETFWNRHWNGEEKTKDACVCTNRLGIMDYVREKEWRGRGIGTGMEEIGEKWQGDWSLRRCKRRRGIDNGIIIVKTEG